MTNLFACKMPLINPLARSPDHLVGPGLSIGCGLLDKAHVQQAVEASHAMVLSRLFSTRLAHTRLRHCSAHKQALPPLLNNP